MKTETKTTQYAMPKIERYEPLTVRPHVQFADQDFNDMANILTYMRDHGTETEIEFCETYLPFCETIVDHKGEVMAYVYQADDQPMLWSCHVDTVHSGNGYQLPLMDEEMMWFAADKQPLGADDGAGVWLLLSLIMKGVGGTYIFHRGEECGGIGSSFMAEYHKDFLRQFNYAVAFDRRRDCSVITHQGGTRCCSDAFAKAFAETLPQLKLDTGGSFTDTKNYTSLIPECSNVSIGYNNEHSSGETLDFGYTVSLRDALVERFKAGIHLPCERDVKDHESLYKNTYPNYAGYFGYAEGASQKDDDDSDFASYKDMHMFDPYEWVDSNELSIMSSRELRKYVMARTKEELLSIVSDLLDEIYILKDELEDKGIKNMENH